LGGINHVIETTRVLERMIYYTFELWIVVHKPVL
jgi:hypothetical protein